MINLLRDCDVIELSRDDLIQNFDCGDADTNDFFNKDAILFQEQSLGVTHFLQHKVSKKIVCAFSLSADSVKTFLLSGSRKKKVMDFIPREKPLQSYPAFLIGRLGVSVEFGKQGVGSQLLDVVQILVAQKFPKIARFLVVDAYNKPQVLTFYQKNDFAFLFADEKQEHDNLKKDKLILPGELLNTRQMFYDMKR